MKREDLWRSILQNHTSLYLNTSGLVLKTLNIKRSSSTPYTCGNEWICGGVMKNTCLSNHLSFFTTKVVFQKQFTFSFFSSNQTQKCFSVVLHFIEKINRSNMSSYEVGDRALVCPYCFNTLTNPLKLPCGYDLCEECVLEGWGEEEINWERDKEVEWRRRVWGYCEEWYLKREREWEWENWGFEWMKWMDDWFWCVWMMIEMKWYSFISHHSHHFISFHFHN